MSTSSVSKEYEIFYLFYLLDWVNFWHKFFLPWKMLPQQQEQEEEEQQQQRQLLNS